MDVGTLLNLRSALHAKTDMADPSDRVSLSKLFLHHLDLLQFDDFKFQLFHMVPDLMKIFQIQNIKVSCRRKTKYGDVAKIWRQRVSILRRHG